MGPTLYQPTTPGHSVKYKQAQLNLVSKLYSNSSVSKSVSKIHINFLFVSWDNLFIFFMPSSHLTFQFFKVFMTYSGIKTW
jgi:hypothetical protein